MLLGVKLSTDKGPPPGSWPLGCGIKEKTIEEKTKLTTDDGPRGQVEKEILGASEGYRQD